jgi:VanZ family protein
MRVPRAAGVLAAIAWCAYLWWMSDDPGFQAGSRVGPNAVLHNLAHVPAFGLLALLLAIALPRRAGWAVTEWSSLRGVWAIAVLYGIVDELHQGRVPNRDGSVIDVLSDAIGAGMLLLLARYAGGPHADAREVRRVLVYGTLASVASAVASTFVPALFPTLRWL